MISYIALLFEFYMFYVGIKYIYIYKCREVFSLNNVSLFKDVLIALFLLTFFHIAFIFELHIFYWLNIFIVVIADKVQ